MIPKQKEMDSIVAEIYNSMLSEVHLKSTLLVLCGDHGMNEGGNHGGASAGETSPALVLMSPKFKKTSKGRRSPVRPYSDFHYYNKVDQADIAPTISSLLGLPIPRNNLGVFIPEFLSLWEDG